MLNENCYRLGAEPSVIRELFAYGLQQAAALGPDRVYDFSLGNPSIPAPEKVTACIQELAAGVDPVKLHGYTVAAGLPEARAAVAADLERRFDLPVRAEELFFSCGAAPALISVIRALTVSPQSEILLLAPFFPEYRPFVEQNGAKAVIVPPDTNGFQINLAGIEALISSNTQALIVNSPNNPSGVVYSREKLAALAALLERKSAQYGHPIYIIADEPYRELAYDGVQVPFIPCIYKNTVVCYSYSKSLSLPGERIGYVYVPAFARDGRELYTAIAGAARLMGHVCPPSLMQMVIARCAGERPRLGDYDENRRLLYGALTEMGYECVRPEGAFYLMIKAPGGDAMSFSQRAKLRHNLLLVPTDDFGCPGYLRLSYCVSKDMIERSLPAFREALKGE